MKIPCVCEAGFHSFSANEMVSIINAFQRGELSQIRFDRGEITAIVPLCIEHADFIAGTEKGKFTGPCNVELLDGSRCGLARGHREGRHGQYAGKGTRRASNAA